MLLLGPVLGGPILLNHSVFPLVDADRWIVRWMSWCYATSWENVTQSLEVSDRWIMQLEISGKNLFSHSTFHVQQHQWFMEILRIFPPQSYTRNKKINEGPLTMISLKSSFGRVVWVNLEVVVDVATCLLGSGVARQLFPCRWVELNLEMLARRPGQAPAPGGFWVYRSWSCSGCCCCCCGVDLGSSLGLAVDEHWFPNPVGSMRVPISCHFHGNQQTLESHFFPFLKDHSEVNAFFCLCSSCQAIGGWFVLKKVGGLPTWKGNQKNGA